MRQNQQQPRIIIFAGTTEGRRLADFLEQQKIPAVLSVATDYGSEVLEAAYQYVEVLEGRMQEEQLVRVLEEYGIRRVIDATHPFATVVTAMLRKVCAAMQVRYDRVLREDGAALGDEIYGSLEEALASLADRPGRIMATTGSKEAVKYRALPDFDSRVWLRVLPGLESIGLCREAGFAGNRIIAMQGPFSKELNKALLKEYDISFLITKQSGKSGGVDEKIEAARELGVRVLSIGRPQEEGVRLETLCAELQNEATAGQAVQVTIVSLGMGNAASLTGEAGQALEEAQVLIGAKRILEALQQEKSLGLAHKPTKCSYLPDEIIAYIHSSEYRRVAVVMSGDVGFYSGAKKLLAAIREEHADWQYRLVCGISSPVYLMARLGRPWQDVALHSLHGTGADFATLVSRSDKSFYLLEDGDLRPLLERLAAFGDEGAVFAYGSRLSYADETVREETVAVWRQELAVNPSALQVAMPAVLYVEWSRRPRRAVIPVLPDAAFVRGEVPMTKEEIRTLSIAKLGLESDSVVYDIGAGTGSVSIQLAKTVVDGTVVAIERHAAAVALIRQNRKLHGGHNIIVVEGKAPLSETETESLPKPTHVFVGGSAGRMEEILAWCLKLNPQVIFVWNAITLESVAQITAAIKSFGLGNEDISLVQVSKDKKVAGYHMMMGQNPIYIIRAGGKTDEI
ncbi:MAG: precorrin-6A reductase [Eubacteriales bacterium]|nr:precorrin-6A reductase [Eubacteriales bacterium]